MASKLYTYAAAHGIVIENRSCSGSYIWDGKSIANHYHTYDRLTDDASFMKVNFTDWQLSHEIAHWIAAYPQFRHLPEYGMRSGTNLGCLPLLPVLPWQDEVLQEKRARRLGLTIYEKCCS